MHITVISAEQTPVGVVFPVHQAVFFVRQQNIKRIHHLNPGMGTKITYQLFGSVFAVRAHFSDMAVIFGINPVFARRNVKIKTFAVPAAPIVDRRKITGNRLQLAVAETVVILKVGNFAVARAEYPAVFANQQLVANL